MVKSCLVKIPQERGAYLGVASGGDPGDFRPDRASLPGHAAHESSQGLTVIQNFTEMIGV